MPGSLSVLISVVGILLAAVSIFIIWFNIDEKYKWGGVVGVVCNMATMLLFASVSTLPFAIICIMVMFATFLIGFEVHKVVRQ